MQPPVGFWDPVGFTADGNADVFARRRQTEIKHGRISMLATMGYMTPEITGKFPGYLSPSLGLKFADVPNGLAAISKVPVLGWAQILAYMGFCEVSKPQSPGTPGAAGDFGWKVLTSTDPEEKKKKLASELANGRLAMVAIMGMLFQDRRSRFRCAAMNGDLALTGEHVFCDVRLTNVCLAFGCSVYPTLWWFG